MCAGSCVVHVRSQSKHHCLIFTLMWPCRFMIGSSDSDDEDEKRVAKSAKDRRFEELQTTCDEIRVSKATPAELCTCPSRGNAGAFRSSGLELDWSCWPDGAYMISTCW